MLEPLCGYLLLAERMFSRLYASDTDPVSYLADARAFGTTFADPLLRRRAFPNDRDPARRLRVGFVSGGSDGSPNIIPSECRIGGTARSYSPAVRDTIERRLREIADLIVQRKA